MNFDDYQLTTPEGESISLSQIYAGFAEWAAQSAPTEKIAVTDTGAPEKFYKTAKGRRLNGVQLDGFNRFWKAYGLFKDKAKSADSWWDQKIDPTEFKDVIFGADQEKAGRRALELSGGKPKWPQGWLTGRRWEEYIELRQQKQKKSVAAVKAPDWVAIGKKHGITWGTERWEDFIKRVKEAIK